MQRGEGGGKVYGTDERRSGDTQWLLPLQSVDSPGSLRVAVWRSEERPGWVASDAGIRLAEWVWRDSSNVKHRCRFFSSYR